MDSKIVLAVLGHGTCGKTTVSQRLASALNLCYRYSTSEFAKLTISLTGEHKDRSKHRVEWAQAIADFNAQDGGIKLYKLMAETHDIYDGIRRVSELRGTQQWVKDKGKIFIPIWVDRDVPVDPTCEIRPCHCRLAVNNRSGMMDLQDNLSILVNGLRAAL